MNKLNLKWVTDTIGNDYKNWKRGDTILLSAQTGTGKTFFIMNSLLDNLPTGDRLLYVCNRTNLKRQLKKDLLKKYNQSIPETLNELDKITTIADKVTITSYHAITNTIKESIYQNDVRVNLSLYSHIVLDECHFIMSDGSFNNKTRFAFDKLIKEWYPSTIRIFISATMDEIRKPIIACLESIKKNGFCLDNFDLIEYSTGNDYSYVDISYFDNLHKIVNTIKNDTTKEKWLIFISDINKDGNFILEELGEEICSLIKSGTESNELNSIINNSKFTKKVLVCTKALDNGININDPLLKNIVIMAWDKISFIQMLGRKRININNPDEIKLYIAKRYKKSFLSKLMKLNDKKKQVDLLSENEIEFYKKYDNDLYIFKDFNELFYRDMKTGKIKINQIGWARLIKDINFCEHMIEKFKNEGEFAFIQEQLSWLGLEESFDESNLMENIVLDKEIETLEQYLESLEGERLHKEEQKMLIEKIDLKVNGRIQKSYRKLNEGLQMIKLPYIILPKKSNDKRYWIVEKIDS